MSKFFRFFPTLTLIPLLSGCHSPFQEPLNPHQVTGINSDEPVPEDRATTSQTEGVLQFPASSQTEVELALQGRRDVLDALSPSPPNSTIDATAGSDLFLCGIGSGFHWVCTLCDCNGVGGTDPIAACPDPDLLVA